jgi:F-type H+-transporting ATPase subunit gamma
MPSLKEVKSRIQSVVSTQQITKAMKMVAAAKLRKSQDRIMQMRPFAARLYYLLQNVSSTTSNEPTWYNSVRAENNVLIIVITSDRGLCGTFNSSIFKATLKLIQDKYADQAAKGKVTILPVGKKAFEFFGKRQYKLNDQFWNIFHGLSFDGVTEVANHVMNGFQHHQYDKVEVVYNEFKNVATQILRTEQFLPIVPSKKKVKTAEVDYIYQPGREEIVNGLIPKSLRVQLYKAVLDSNAAENGARMTAMDKATENAGELLKELRLTYNRTRQAAITKEILEIVAGAEALKAS